MKDVGVRKGWLLRITHGAGVQHTPTALKLSLIPTLNNVARLGISSVSVSRVVYEASLNRINATSSAGLLSYWS